ncbi:MAG: peptidylprolyl isomerase [Rhodospirillaceae bacterium]|jgi:peptidyl-prolyl cis-trans isomerase C|nr:peptidylprolyl isomerase [Rhodospirillaceae bacterium]|tara:strand:+ start:1015 stop:1845 length:831 start_codon:yes stop_codon:yes gene_type:complete
MNTIKLTIATAGVMALVVGYSNTRALADGDDSVVAEVNGYKFFQSDLDRERNQLPPQSRSYPKHVIENFLIKSLVNTHLLSEEARKKGLEKENSVRRRVERFEKQVLEQAYLNRRTKTEVTDTKLQVAYQEMVKNSLGGEEVRARHILVETEEQAMEVIARLKKGEDFAALAKSVSTGPSGKVGGDLGYFTVDKMVPPFAKAAFSTKPAEYTPKPVRTQFGWHIIKVEDKRQQQPPSYNEVKADLQRSMSQDIKGKLIAELREKADITVNIEKASK